MSFKELLFADVEKFLEENENFTKKDLLAVVSSCFDENIKKQSKKLKMKKEKIDVEKKPKKENKKLKLEKEVEPAKEKKPLTAYQQFAKITLKTLKEREDAKPEGEVKLKQTDLMKELGVLWKQEKDNLKDE